MGRESARWVGFGALSVALLGATVPCAGVCTPAARPASCSCPVHRDDAASSIDATCCCGEIGQRGSETLPVSVPVSAFSVDLPAAQPVAAGAPTDGSVELPAVPIGESGPDPPRYLLNSSFRI